MQTMAESATQTITIEAPLAQCFAIATDFEQYPAWAHDVKQAVVKERDNLDRATEVEFRASALGRSVSPAIIVRLAGVTTIDAISRPAVAGT